MLRDVSARFEATLGGPCTIVYAMAVAHGIPRADERLDIRVDGREVWPAELVERHGTRLHRVETDGSAVVIDYRAIGVGDADPGQGDLVDAITYLRPSRYCESDALGPTAWARFGGLAGAPLLTAVGDFVHDTLRYVSGASRPTDGAVQTLLSRQGVCRDYAHLVIALLRAMNVPARMAAVYAPGLTPMEFHAVAEAYLDGVWSVVDATRRAPRQSLVRIATGRDAADTAFITNFGAELTLTRFEVGAVVVDGDLPSDDHTGPARLA